MKSAIFALLAGSAAAFAPASVNKVRSIRIEFFRADRAMTFCRYAEGGRNGWSGDSHTKSSSMSSGVWDDATITSDYFASSSYLSEETMVRDVLGIDEEMRKRERCATNTKQRTRSSPRILWNSLPLALHFSYHIFHTCSHHIFSLMYIVDRPPLSSA